MSSLMYCGAEKIKTKKQVAGTEHLVNPSMARLISHWSEIIFNAIHTNNVHKLFVNFGLGQRYPETNGIPIKTTVGEMISLFLERGMPLKNIITLEKDEKVASEWADSGITILCCDWNNYDTMVVLKKYISDRTKNRTKGTIIHADNYDGLKNIGMYTDYANMLNPMAMFLPFYLQGAGALKRHVIPVLDKWDKYKLMRWGYCENFKDEAYNGFVRVGKTSAHIACMLRNSGSIRGHHNVGR